MIFENKVLEKAKPNDLFTFEDLCKYNKIDVVKKRNPTEDNNLIQNAKEILIHSSDSLDLLLFIQSAIYQNSNDLKYTLYPPSTTSILDCDYMLKKLIDCNILQDVFFSQYTKSYRIVLHSPLEHNIKEILSIGLCCLLEEAGVSEIYVDGCLKCTDGSLLNTDLICRVNDNIMLFKFEIAAGLTYSVPFHEAQMHRFIERVTQFSDINSEHVHTYFIISDHTKKILPFSKQVIGLSDLPELINSLNINIEAN